MRTNPVAALKPVKVPPSQTLPFDEDQVAAILKACEEYPIQGIYGEQNRSRLTALTLLMRYSGLRIGDAVTCPRERLVGSKLFLYQAKTGTPVYCPLPPVAVDALKAFQGPNPAYFFWTGNGKTKRNQPSPTRNDHFANCLRSPASRGIPTCSATRSPWSC